MRDPEYKNRDTEAKLQKYYMDLYNTGPTPNKEQNDIIEALMNGLKSVRHVVDYDAKSFVPNVQRYFFVTGEGGAGKTFTFNVVQ